jgi:ABC-type uncharacterized transport system substrate-binding protein
MTRKLAPCRWLGCQNCVEEVELLIQVVAGISRIGVVANPDNPTVVSQLREAEKAIRTVGLQAEVVYARLAGEFENALNL